MAGNKSEKFALKINEQEPDLKAGITNLKRKAEFGSRNEDTVSVNPISQASMRLFDKNVNMAASQETMSKMNDKQSIQQSFEEKHTTNRFSLDTYDIMVNGHKLNPNLWEYSDFKEFTDMYGGVHQVGAFAMFGTVLIPCWDSQLHRYVLVRRLARMPMFSPKMNVPEILKTLGIDDPTEVVFQHKKKQETETAQEYYDRVGKEFDKKKYDTGAKSSNPSSSTPAAGSGKCDSETIEKALQWCIQTANEPGHGYSQDDREGPNYDCTSFVCAGLQAAGLDIPFLGGPSFDDDILNYGFDRIPFPGLEGLRRGDILSSPSHVEFYLGNGENVAAHSANYAPDDQISVSNYWDNGWTCVLRYRG